MANPNQLIDAVKTAKSIHDGDYSFLRDKSFVIRGNMKNNKGRGRDVKKHKPKYTLNQLGITVDKLGATVDSLSATVKKLAITVNDLAIEMREGFKQVNARLDKVEQRLDYNGLKPLPNKQN